MFEQPDMQAMIRGSGDKASNPLISSGDSLIVELLIKEKVIIPLEPPNNSVMSAVQHINPESFFN